VRDLSETPAVLPDDPELDAAVVRILDGAPYTGYMARRDDGSDWAAKDDALEPRFVPLHAAVALCFGLLLGFVASAILL